MDIKKIILFVFLFSFPFTIHSSQNKPEAEVTSDFNRNVKEEIDYIGKNHVSKKVTITNTCQITVRLPETVDTEQTAMLLREQMHLCFLENATLYGNQQNTVEEPEEEKDLLANQRF